MLLLNFGLAVRSISLVLHAGAVERKRFGRHHKKPGKFHPIETLKSAINLSVLGVGVCYLYGRSEGHVGAQGATVRHFLSGNKCSPQYNIHNSNPLKIFQSQKSLTTTSQINQDAYLQRV